MRRALLVCMLCMLSASLPGCTSKDSKYAPKGSSRAKASQNEAPDHEAEGRRAAKGLLREYVDSYRSIAMSGDAKVAVEVLRDLRKEAVSTQNLPEQFERRYFAMLDAAIALIDPAKGEAAKAQREAKVEAFVRSAGGPDAKYDPDGGIAAISKLIVEEIVALRMLVDPSVSRDDVYGQYFPQR